MSLDGGKAARVGQRGLSWWRSRTEAARRKAEEKRAIAEKEAAELAARRAWRCARCGKKEEDHFGLGHPPETDPTHCEFCVRVQHMQRVEQRKRVAELAAMVAGRNLQYSPRGGVDTHLTVEAAWEIAEALYKKETGS